MERACAGSCNLQLPAHADRALVGIISQTTGGSPTPMLPTHVNLFDRPVAHDLSTLMSLLHQAGDARRHHHHVSLNANKLHLASGDPALRSMLAEAETAAADGAAIRWLARRWQLDEPERITGCDLATRLVEGAAQRGWRTYLFGGAPRVVARVAERFRDTVVGCCDGYAGDDEAVAAAIAAAHPHLVLVALGSPRSEHFIARWRPEALCLGVGGTFDVLAGEVPRAPRFTHGIGLEGAWRVATQPRRLPGAVRMAATLWRIARQGPAAVGAS